MLFFKHFQASRYLNLVVLLFSAKLDPSAVESPARTAEAIANSPFSVKEVGRDITQDRTLEVYFPLITWAGSPAEWSAMVQAEIFPSDRQ